MDWIVFFVVGVLLGASVVSTTPTQLVVMCSLVIGILIGIVISFVLLKNKVRF